MKKNYFFTMLMSAILFISCSTEKIETNNINLIEENNYTRDSEVDLIAGQNMDSGSVIVTEIDGNLEVTYTTDGDWILLETHLYVGSQEGMPHTRRGNPKIGKFPYATEHDAGTTTFTYSDLLEIPQGTCVWVAAHAVVVNTVTGEEETAWGNGEYINGNNWAMWFQVCNDIPSHY